MNPERMSSLNPNRIRRHRQNDEGLAAAFRKSPYFVDRSSCYTPLYIVFTPMNRRKMATVMKISQKSCHVRKINTLERAKSLDLTVSRRSCKNFRQRLGSTASIRPLRYALYLCRIERKRVIRAGLSCGARSTRAPSPRQRVDRPRLHGPGFDDL